MADVTQLSTLLSHNDTVLHKDLKPQWQHTVVFFGGGFRGSEIPKYRWNLAQIPNSRSKKFRNIDTVRSFYSTCSKISNFIYILVKIFHSLQRD